LAVRGPAQNSGKRHELSEPLTNLLILAEVGRSSRKHCQRDSKLLCVWTM
jgi:hypothetical protein